MAITFRGPFNFTFKAGRGVFANVINYFSDHFTEANDSEGDPQLRLSDDIVSRIDNPKSRLGQANSFQSFFNTPLSVAAPTAGVLPGDAANLIDGYDGTAATFNSTNSGVQIRFGVGMVNPFIMIRADRDAPFVLRGLGSTFSLFSSTATRRTANGITSWSPASATDTIHGIQINTAGGSGNTMIYEVIVMPRRTLSYTPSTRVLADSLGGAVALPEADGTNAGLLASLLFTKLSTIEGITHVTSLPTTISDNQRDNFWYLTQQDGNYDPGIYYAESTTRAGTSRFATTKLTAGSLTPLSGGVITGYRTAGQIGQQTLAAVGSISPGYTRWIGAYRVAGEGFYVESTNNLGSSIHLTLNGVRHSISYYRHENGRHRYRVVDLAVPTAWNAVSGTIYDAILEVGAGSSVRFDTTEQIYIPKALLLQVSLLDHPVPPTGTGDTHRALTERSVARKAYQIDHRNPRYFAPLARYVEPSGYQTAFAQDTVDPALSLDRNPDTAAVVTNTGASDEDLHKILLATPTRAPLPAGRMVVSINRVTGTPADTVEALNLTLTAHTFNDLAGSTLTADQRYPLLATLRTGWQNPQAGYYEFTVPEGAQVFQLRVVTDATTGGGRTVATTDTASLYINALEFYAETGDGLNRGVVTNSGNTITLYDQYGNPLVFAPTPHTTPTENLERSVYPVYRGLDSHTVTNPERAIDRNDATFAVVPANTNFVSYVLSPPIKATAGGEFQVRVSGANAVFTVAGDGLGTNIEMESEDTAERLVTIPVSRTSGYVNTIQITNNHSEPPNPALHVHSVVYVDDRTGTYGEIAQHLLQADGYGPPALVFYGLGQTERRPLTNVTGTLGPQINFSGTPTRRADRLIFNQWPDEQYGAPEFMRVLPTSDIPSTVDLLGSETTATRAILGAFFGVSPGRYNFYLANQVTAGSPTDDRGFVMGVMQDGTDDFLEYGETQRKFNFVSLRATNPIAPWLYTEFRRVSISQGTEGVVYFLTTLDGPINQDSAAMFLEAEKIS